MEQEVKDEFNVILGKMEVMEMEVTSNIVLCVGVSMEEIVEVKMFVMVMSDMSSCVFCVDSSMPVTFVVTIELGIDAVVDNNEVLGKIVVEMTDG
jgi:hypothetical protein